MLDELYDDMKKVASRGNSKVGALSSACDQPSLLATFWVSEQTFSQLRAVRLGRAAHEPFPCSALALAVLQSC